MIGETMRGNRNLNKGSSPKHVNLAGSTTFMMQSSNDGSKKNLGDINNKEFDHSYEHFGHEDSEEIQEMHAKETQ